MSEYVCNIEERKTMDSYYGIIILFRQVTDVTPPRNSDGFSQKLKSQILEALHIRNMQPGLNRINFQTSANVLKCL